MADKKPAMKFSLSLGAKKQTAAPTTLKRPAVALQGFEDEVIAAPTAQAVSAFDAAAGGAIDTSAPIVTTGPVVIAPQANRDWRAESRKKQRGRLPDGAGQGYSADVTDQDIGASKIAFGLTVVKAEQGDVASEQTTEFIKAEPVSDAPEPEKPTEDQLALQALLGQRPESNLVISMDEETAFKNDFSNAPPAPSLEDYAKVAIEDFGAAYLRGFGWKSDDSAQQKTKPEKRPARRSALLGIGAKEEAAAGIELGEWGKGAKGKRKVDQPYNPVLLRDKVTGETLTEEELKKRQEQQKLVELEPIPERKKRSPARELEYRTEKSSRRHKYEDEDERSGSHRRRDDRERDRDRDREKRRDRDYDSKHRSSRRDRSTSTDRKRKRRDYDERDSDSSKRRHKEDRYKEDRYKDDRHREDRYDRGSSKRDDRDRERHSDSGRRRKQEVY
ncbi:uncharacterized protein BDZ99DRAFT_311698 [Mytilinidion resinicola]|uniref:Pre-mRNA-splicing factor n=1 Tax=Mytilinidion resinicola TaxID=574789 RepID=A0A6A6YPI0_9PEZI|nr:uncharacterized protein BDZ99DRAFT_311698 [Mytilinidion resinicola]KAF2810428.1 hypothetical protein BDZ99DRAFT_311698 [Mytilinidion resinicola]